MEVGVLFDIDELGGGFYGPAAWTIVMGSLNPNNLSLCQFFSGDTNIPGLHKPYTHCIGINTTDTLKTEYFWNVFKVCENKGLMPIDRRFVKGDLSKRFSLPIDGHVDPRGRFVMADTECTWIFKVADQAGWKYLPSDDWVKWFAEEYRKYTQPSCIAPWSEEFTRCARQALIEAGYPANKLILPENGE